MDALARLRPDLVTVPNFSLFADVPRHDNLFNMKRIAIAWLELVFAGIPTALHVNARTDRDWERWAEFIFHQPASQTLSFEFATGAKINGRGIWYVDRLNWLARQVNRPLAIAVRGTLGLESLRRNFEKVFVVDTSAYSKAIRRFRARRDSYSVVRWRRSFTLARQPIDHILQHNVDVCREVYGNPIAAHCQRGNAQEQQN